MDEIPRSALADASDARTPPHDPRPMRRRAMRNTFSNVLGQVLVLGFGFILTPFIMRELGATLYGLWVLINSLVAYSVLLDLGIATAVIKYVAEFRARGEHAELQRLVSTALVLYLLMGGLAVLLSIALASFFTRIFQVPAEHYEMVHSMILLMGLATGIAIPCSTTNAVLRGLQRFDQANMIAISGSLLNMAGWALVLLLGGGLNAMVAVSIPISLIMQIPSIHMIHANAPQLRITLRHATRRLTRTVFAYSWVLFIGQISEQLQNKTDEIVIGAALPVSMVTPYSLGRRLSEVSRMFAYQFVKILLPLSSELHANSDHARLQAVFLTSSRIALASFIPVALCICVMAGSILTLWVGAQFADASIIVVILTLASFFSMVNMPATSILQGMARHRLLFLISITTGIANLLLSMLLVRPFGVVGVAIGTFIPAAIESVVFLLPYCNRVLGVSFRRMAREVYVPAFLPALPAFVALLLFRENIGTATFPLLLLAGAMGLTIYIAVYLCMRVNSAERQTLADVAHMAQRFVAARLRNT